MWKLCIKKLVSLCNRRTYSVSMRFPVSSALLCKGENPQPIFETDLEKVVDFVDKSVAQDMIADSYDISGSHGYQQVAVHTIL